LVRVRVSSYEETTCRFVCLEDQTREPSRSESRSSRARRGAQRCALASRSGRPSAMLWLNHRNQPFDDESSSDDSDSESWEVLRFSCCFSRLSSLLFMILNRSLAFGPHTHAVVLGFGLRSSKFERKTTRRVVHFRFLPVIFVLFVEDELVVGSSATMVLP